MLVQSHFSMTLSLSMFIGPINNALCSKRNIDFDRRWRWGSARCWMSGTRVIINIESWTLGSYIKDHTMCDIFRAMIAFVGWLNLNNALIFANCGGLPALLDAAHLMQLLRSLSGGYQCTRAMLKAVIGWIASRSLHLCWKSSITSLRYILMFAERLKDVAGIFPSLQLERAFQWPERRLNSTRPW